MRLTKPLRRNIYGIVTYPDYYLLFKSGKRQKVSRSNLHKVAKYLGISIDE